MAAICALASRLGVDVVAEGVEDRDFLQMLTELGCRYALARPLTSAQVTAAFRTKDNGWHRSAASRAHDTQG